MIESLDFSALMTIISDIAAGPTAKGVITVIGILLTIIVYVVARWDAYSKAKEQRELEAHELTFGTIRKQNEITQKLQTYAAQSIIDCVDISYKQDYQFCLSNLKNEDAILRKFSSLFHEGILKIIRNENLKDDQKAALIIKVVRKM